MDLGLGIPRILLSLEFGCKGTEFLANDSFKYFVAHGLYGNKSSFISHKMSNFATENGIKGHDALK